MLWVRYIPVWSTPRLLQQTGDAAVVKLGDRLVELGFQLRQASLKLGKLLVVIELCLGMGLSEDIVGLGCCVVLGNKLLLSPLQERLLDSIQ